MYCGRYNIQANGSSVRVKSIKHVCAIQPTTFIAQPVAMQQTARLTFSHCCLLLCCATISVVCGAGFTTKALSAAEISKAINDTISRLASTDTNLEARDVQGNEVAAVLNETQLVEQSCDTDLQQLSLLLFYIQTNGDEWTNSTNWGSEDPCYSSSTNISLPPHCCWHGVRCCDSLVCPRDQLDNTICNCTLGIVTEINMVRFWCVCFGVCCDVRFI